jgi:uncharacterized membrane protein YhdT
MILYTEETKWFALSAINADLLFIILYLSIYFQFAPLEHDSEKVMKL